jgi:hypothetical protein
LAEIFTSQGAPPVSTIPVTNLPLVSTTPAYLELRKSPPILENGPNGMLRGLGETDLLKRPDVKNLVALSL